MRFSFKREPLSEEEEQRRSALKDAEGRLKEARKTYEGGVKAARKRLSDAEKNHKRRVNDARKTLEKKRESKKLGSLAGVTLYDDKVVTPDGTSTLSPEVRATADSAGNLAVSSRVTATRLVTLGVFALAAKKKKAHDTRELYLVVETPDFMCVRSLDPKQGNAARQFAANIVNAGKQAPRAIEQKREMVEIAERLLREAESDRQAVEEASKALHAAEADTGEVDGLKQEVDSYTPVTS